MAISELSWAPDETAGGGFTTVLVIGVLVFDLVLTVAPALIAVLAGLGVLR